MACGSVGHVSDGIVAATSAGVAAIPPRQKHPGHRTGWIGQDRAHPPDRVDVGAETGAGVRPDGLRCGAATMQGQNAAFLRRDWAGEWDGG